MVIVFWGSFRRNYAARTSAALGAGNCTTIYPFIACTHKLCGQYPHNVANYSLMKRQPVKKCGHRPHNWSRIPKSSLTPFHTVTLSSYSPLKTTLSAASTKSNARSSIGALFLQQRLGWWSVASSFQVPIF